VDRLGDDRAGRDVAGIAGKNEGAELVFGTDLRINVGGIANCFLDLLSHRLALPGWNDSGNVPRRHRNGIVQSIPRRTIRR
jgi:hypothetical protein